MKYKNIANNVSINADGAVHIGDKIYNFNLDKAPMETEDKENFKVAIQELVANNKIEKALEVLTIMAKNDPISKQATISLTQSWKELKHNELMGTLRRQDANVERNQIVAKILALIESL